MKKILLPICAALLLLVAPGCEKVIEFKGTEMQRRLTLSAQAEAGEPLEAFIASSIFFLSDDGNGAAYTEGLDAERGQVRCFVNGSVVARVLERVPDKYATSLRYRAVDYTPSPGDHIRLEASFPGFDPVWAETDVPLLPSFEIVSTTWRKMEGDYYAYLAADIVLAVSDDASYDKYYFLQPVLEYIDPYTPGEVYATSWGFASSDILFRQASGSDALHDAMELFDSEGNYFSDDLIKGQRHVFTITLTTLPQKEEIAHLRVHVAAVNESLYWYSLSFARLMENNLFAEGVTLYSNVHGGYGVFCAAASRWLEVER